MTTYLLAMLSWALPSALDPVRPETHFLFIVLIFLLTFMLPVSNLFIFKMFGTIKTLHMVNREERHIPFVFISIIHIAITYLFYTKYNFGLNDNLFKIIVVIDLLVITSTVSNFFFKVSVHSLSIWGMTGITLLLTKISEVNTLFYVTIGMVAMCGVVMSSRLQLAAHTPREVMWGAALGLLSSIVGMLILF